jgi:hypothetical protein
MHKRIAILIVLAAVLLGTTAWAGEQIDLYCLKLPGCCQITCVTIDLECCGCGNGQGPLLAEFRDCKGAVLGTATFTNWCCGETSGMLDKPVDSNAVNSIRLIKQDDNTIVTWATIRVYCGDNCCGKWKKIFKGDLWCWDQIPAPKPVVEQAPPPAPPAEEPPYVAPEPEDKPDFSNFPEPQPEPEPEVIVVPGNG